MTGIELPTMENAAAVIGPAFIAINQRGQALKNQAEDLQNRVMEYVKSTNGTLFAEIQANTTELENIEGMMEEMGEHIKAWFDGPSES